VYYPSARDTRWTYEANPSEAVKRRISALGCAAVAFSLVVVQLAAAGTPSTALAKAKQAGCLYPPAGEQWLPIGCLHGPIQYLREYPAMKLTTPAQRNHARLFHDQLVAAAEDENWRDVRAAADLGYRMHVGPRKPGDLKVHYFHAGRAPGARMHPLLNPRRPKALIYANAPGRPLVLVGVMYTARPGERGPTPAGQFTRWHSHLTCGDGHSMSGMVGMSAHKSNDLHSVMKLPANGGCPPGEHLHLGNVEMTHIWFTHDLRSAFGVRPPAPELCKAGLVPTRYC
jgi:hypothetical protein